MFWKKIGSRAYVILALITAIIFFYPLIFEDQTLFFRDIQSIFYPMKYFLARSFASGTIPFWCPLYFCGAPFMSDIQTGVFYLPSLIFLIAPYYLSLNFYLILHVILCFCFVYLFIRAIGLSIPAAIFSAIAYSYGGYVLSSLNLPNNLAVITWLPAILWSYQKALSQRSLPHYLLTIIFLCFAILGGEPQLFIFTAFLTFCFGILCISKNVASDYSILKYSLLFAVMFVAALLTTIVQWGPTYLDYQHSIRLIGFSFNETAHSSVSWDGLKHLLIPMSFDRSFGSDHAALTFLFPPHGNVPWLMSIYPGVLVTLLAVCGVLFRRSRDTVFWLITFLLGIVFALGGNTALYKIVYKIFPFFRFPEKFYFFSNIGLIVLAAYGFDAVATFAMKLNARTKYFLWIIPLVLFADLYIAHAGLNLTCHKSLYQFSDPFLEPIMKDRDVFRVYVDEPSFVSRLPGNISINKRHNISQAIKASNIGIIDNIHYVDGKTGMELQYQWVITEILQQQLWPQKIKLMHLANVKYIVSAENLDKNPDVMKHFTRINSLLYQVKNHSPRAWMVGKINPLGTWTMQDYNNQTFDYRTSAMGPIALADRYKIPYYQSVDKIEYGNNQVSIDVTASRRGIVVLSESSYPGWHATLNGKPANIVRLNYLFQGVEVDSGKQQIVFRYQPPLFYLYLMGSIFTIFVLMLTYLIHVLYKRKT